jgi:hypothetical protein
MAAQTSAQAGQQPARWPSIRPGGRASGPGGPRCQILAAGAVAVLAGVAVLANANKQTALIWVGIIVLLIATVGLVGLTPVAPGQARVIQLFGKYRGTVRDPGRQWVSQCMPTRAGNNAS